MENKNIKILNFIKKQKFTVISTISYRRDKQSEGSVIAFSEAENLEIIFGTYNTNRKYENIKNNPEISLVFGFSNNPKITVQYEGTAEELSGDEKDFFAKRHVEKNPESEKYLYKTQQRYFKITPKWIRYSDFDKDPHEIFEITFNNQYL